MKSIVTFCFVLFSVTTCFSQLYYSNFNDGTLQGWTNTDGSTTNMTVENGNNSSKHLQKVCDGSNGPLGEMAIKNLEFYTGNHNCNDPDGFDCLAGVELYVKTNNPLELNLRLGYEGANGTKLVSDLGSYYNAPTGSDWYWVSFEFYPQVFTVVEGTGSIEETLEDIVEFRIINNEAVSYEGIYSTDTMIIDEVFYLFLLSTEDNTLAEVALYPNPATESFVVELPSEVVSEVAIFNISGELIKTESINTNFGSINVSELANGMYFAQITTETGSITRKFLKN